MDIDPKKYFLHYALPCVFGTILFFIFLIFAFPGIFGGTILLLLFGLAVLVEVVAFGLYPVILRQNRRNKIEQEMQLFITRAGVLSTSEISRKGIFDILDEMKEYGELAKEINKVYVLIENWGLSIGDACRRVAKNTPSLLFADFLERLAYAVDAGEEPKDFFASEQEIILEQYKILYTKAADTINLVAEVFVALIIVMSFLILIVALAPFIIGLNTEVLFYLTAILFVAIELLMMYIFIAYVPRERIWQDSDIRTAVTRKINYFFIASVLASVVMGIAVFILIRPIFDPHIWIFDLTVPICTAISITPLLISGYYTQKTEQGIVRKDNDFPAFIRSLGSTSETSSIVPVDALKRLRRHDFGPLTGNIEDLYARLNVRINPVRAWKYFGAETGSDLITKFSSMFVRGLEAGGKPAKAANIISYNFTQLLALRKKRYSIAATLSGTFIGIALILSIVFFMAAGLVDILNHIVTETETYKSYIEVPLLFVQPYSMTFFINIMFALIVIHAAITALIQRIVAAGHKYGATLNFVIMVWLGAIMSEVAPWVIRELLK